MGKFPWVVTVHTIHLPFFFGLGGMGLYFVSLGVDLFFWFSISDGMGDIWAALPPCWLDVFPPPPLLLGGCKLHGSSRDNGGDEGLSWLDEGWITNGMVSA